MSGVLVGLQRHIAAVKCRMRALKALYRGPHFDFNDILIFRPLTYSGLLLYNRKRRVRLRAAGYENEKRTM